jgi:hypothetical protein
VNIRRARLLPGLVALALAAPPASAHGNQILFARVEIGGDGAITLELTADHADNPFIADAAEARAVLGEALEVRLGAHRFALDQLGELRFEDRTSYSADAPLAAGSGPHRLMTAVWRARLPGQDVTFAAKERTPLDVVLWRAGAPTPAGWSRWVLLIAGEASPVFTLTPATAAPVQSAALGLAMVLAAPLLAWRWRRRQARALALAPI